ncbi:MAG: hypothetical protein O7I42_20360 [Alphaproteobacteria bacterium]|nr:hypothetical protein [Alphaproteobacteria bacterium]
MAGTTAVVVDSASAGGIVAQPRSGDPLLGLTPDQLDRFFIGKESYSRVFTAEEGLGPIFNQDSCGSCHNNTVGGTGTVTVTRAGFIDRQGNFDPLVDFGGSLFQQESISEECAEVVPDEANSITLRVTNGMMGYGLVEAIADGDIEALADPDDADRDGISGRVHIVGAVEDELDHVGRFGWKAHAATMMTFSAGASLNELGITNPFKPVDNDPNGIFPPELADCDDVADPEEDFDFIAELTDFQRFITAPPQTPKSGMTGEALFMSIGCGDCHVRAFTTADDPNLEDALRNKLVVPYSDFLLHDMGELGDLVVQGGAEGTEFRTTPMMGLRTRDPIIHDGRVAGFFFSDRIEIAVAYHCYTDSEARPSAQLFLNGLDPQFCDFNPEIPPCPDCPLPVAGGLSDDERALVIDFLASLGRREFNHADVNDIDDDVEMDDFLIFASCFGGGPYTHDDLCAIDDVNQDHFVDEVDFDVFLTVYSGTQTDCNANGVLDIIDIILGDSDDLNGDGLPDECCTGDIDGDGNVGAADLLALLFAWGPNPLHPADLDGNGTVGASDLLTLLANWGVCPR